MGPLSKEQKREDWAEARAGTVPGSWAGGRTLGWCLGQVGGASDMDEQAHSSEGGLVLLSVFSPLGGLEKGSSIWNEQARQDWAN